MLPLPDTTVSTSRWRLISECLRPNTVPTPSRLNFGARGSRARCATGIGTSVPSTVTRSASIQPPNVRWSTKLSAVPSSSSAAMRKWFSFGTSPSSICPLIPRCTTRAEPSPSVNHRYLPRRPVPVTCVPSSRAARSAGPASWRRTARGWCTRTALMVRPATCACKPRRTTSTSGSSGINTRGGKRVPRGGGGLQLGLLLRPADALAVLDIGDDDRRGEFLVVVRACGGHHIRWCAHATRRGQLLKAALPVQPRAQRRRGVKQRAEQPQNHLTRHHGTVLQIDCAQQGFDPIGQDARLVGAAGVLLALAQQKVGAEAIVGQMPPDVGERLRVDDAGTQLGQIAL